MGTSGIVAAGRRGVAQAQSPKVAARDQRKAKTQGFSIETNVFLFIRDMGRYVITEAQTNDMLRLNPLAVSIHVNSCVIRHDCSEDGTGLYHNTITS